MKTFSITLGLGMGQHHQKTYEIQATLPAFAESLAKSRFYREVEAEIGKDARIWGKVLIVDSITEVNQNKPIQAT